MAEEKSKCINCGSTSDEKLLIKCEHEGKPAWVCARCLPVFIHGAH